MSFSYQVKNEICQNRPFRQRSMRALAYGLLLFGKRFDLEEISIHTEHKAVARLYADCITDLVGISESITVQEVKRQDRRSVFLVTVDGLSDRVAVLSYFGRKAGETELRIAEGRMKKPELPVFLAGVFLACGGISDPEKGYQVEFSTPNAALRGDLEELLAAELSPPKQTERRNDYLLYYKESEYIEDLLTYIGAPKSALEVMEVKIVKQLRNKVNRETNCETANIEKTVGAAMVQIEAIEKIQRAGGLSSLDEQLQELVQLRLQNPEMSLRELGETLVPPISRSGVNHRLKRILEYAQTL